MFLNGNVFKIPYGQKDAPQRHRFQSGWNCFLRNRKERCSGKQQQEYTFFKHASR
jgi:hypothetical protein